MPYAIASHRWAEQEATYQDMKAQRNTDTAGDRKVQAFAAYVQNNMPSIKLLWIDTCCINKDSAAELSESINSMSRWYQKAEICIAYLKDCETSNAMHEFVESEWFRRGWTLQELLVPQLVIFVTKTWSTIGHKGKAPSAQCPEDIGPNLEHAIGRITDLPQEILHDYATSVKFSPKEKMKWMEGRETTRPEDMSYALYGILDLNLGANYGEGMESARSRLEIAILQRNNVHIQQAQHYREMMTWLSPPNPGTNHDSARARYEPGTGKWLLEHTKYAAWKSGATRLLWVHGKAGSGKTVICSTAIEDIQTHCETTATLAQAFFYFSFSDKSKQTYRNMLLSLIAQLCCEEPGLSLLRQSRTKLGSVFSANNELERILSSTCASYARVFIHIDGLDECPVNDEVREDVLRQLQNLLDSVPNLHLLATSRDEQDIRGMMVRSGAVLVPIANAMVEGDIQKFVLTTLSRDPQLSRLDANTKTLVEHTLVKKADGMYVCQSSHQLLWS